VADVTDQWGADRLDLDAYLARLGVEGGPPDADTLRRLHRAHLDRIPFENLDVLLGRGVSVDLPDVAAKLVDARRGGYCYEHALLLGAALERLGFDVERRLARIGDPDMLPMPRSHLVLHVRTPDDRTVTWLADTGFGSGLLEPLPLRDGGTGTQGAGWGFRTVLGADGGWRLQERRADHWLPLYTMPPERTYLVDVAAANHVTSTSPTSRFTQRVRVQRKDETTLTVVEGAELTVRTAAGEVRRRTLTPEQLGPQLREMRLELPADDVARLAATLS
jgi:N-hydroxyarylamine O-acetyltransferase